MSRHGAQVHGSGSSRRGLRWLAGVLAAAAVAVLLGWGASVALADVLGPGGPPPPACLPIVTNTELPAMSPSGAGVVGTALSTTDGRWHDSCGLAITVTYQWYRGASAISGAINSTYTTTSADVGSQITVQVTGSDINSDQTVTATGVFLVTVPLGAADYYPIWSHGPVSVNEATGNMLLSLPTPSYPTATGTLGFSLTYNSQQTAAGNYGLGVGWMLAAGDGSPPSQLHDHSKDASPSPSAEVDWPDTGAQFFQQVGSSDTYQPLQADGSSLTKNSDGSWTLVNGDGTYTFAVESSSGIAPLNGAELAATSNSNAQLSYAFDASGRVTSVTYKETPTPGSSSEVLTFNWSCTGFKFCVTGPDGVQWKYSADGTGEITTVNDGTRNLVTLTYTNGLVTKIQNADDLDPTHSSPGYNGNHALTLVYDGSSPKKMDCLIDGPISGQAAASQPACAGGGTASESTWSFNYAATCPALKAPAVSHSVTQGARAGCTLLTDPDQQPSGPGITVLYDAFYRPLEYDDARLSSSNPRISLVQYNSQNQLAWSEDPGGNPTDNSYDPVNGELLSTTGPTPAGTSSRPVTKYRYDEQTIGTASAPGNPLTGLAGSYWANNTLTGLPASRETDPAPGSGQTGFSFSSWPSSVAGNSSGFSVRWTGEVAPPETGYYTFTTNSVAGVDGTHLVVNGVDLIENMTSKSSPISSFIIYLQQGVNYPITLEYAHNSAGTSGATLTLKWDCTDLCNPVINTQQVPVSDLLPAWQNQTSVVSPAGRVSFQHFLDPASGQSDYSLVKVGSQNLITSHTYDSLGRMAKNYMPKANASATINATTGNLSGTPNSTYETDYTYYGDGATAAPPAACGGGTAVNQYGQLQTTSFPQTGGLHSIVTVYNSAGSPIAATNGKGTSCLTYDAENRLTKQTALGDQNTAKTITYDPNGTALTATNPSGTVTTYYDEAGRLIDTTDASGAEGHFVYDADGNALSRRANITTLGGTTCPSAVDYCTTYTYDAADELSTETDAAGHAWSFYYDNRGNLRGTQYPNGTFSWIDTDSAGNVTGQYNRHGTITGSTTTPPADASPLADYNYTYVDSGGVFQDGKKVSQLAKSGSTSQTTSYVYDNAGRLSQAFLPGNICRNYSYDLDSNRSLIQQSPTGCNGTFSTTATYTYDPATTPGLDELTKTVAGSTTTNYGYTSDGQVSSQGTTSDTWNGFSQLATATVGSNTVTYTYDANGDLQNRVSSSPATTTHYLLGDLFETDSSGTITTSYTDGPAGDLARYTGAPTTSSTVYYEYYDAHGNLVAEALSNGSLNGWATYDPFGTPQNTVGTNATIHRFVGQWDKQYDTTTFDILMGARPYDPNTGRFLAVDPVPGGSLNSYDYAGQDPINNYDLNGECVFVHGNRRCLTDGEKIGSESCRGSFTCKQIRGKNHAGDPNNYTNGRGRPAHDVPDHDVWGDGGGDPGGEPPVGGPADTGGGGTHDFSSARARRHRRTYRV